MKHVYRDSIAAKIAAHERKRRTTGAGPYTMMDLAVVSPIGRGFRRELNRAFAALRQTMAEVRHD